MRTLLLLLAVCLPQIAYSFDKVSAHPAIESACPQCLTQSETLTGTYILDYGEEALLARAWLTDNAKQSIDVQYFIWSTDNIGTLASESLLRAAERGVRVRVIVDDFLIEADNDTLLALNAHPNVTIKIYNPNYSVGTSRSQRFLNLMTDFRGVNQRMHDKVAIFDKAIGITGGRNMADEYFDFDEQYNFRDRDVVLMGQAVNAMSTNFDAFWQSPLSKPVNSLLGDRQLDREAVTDLYRKLHAYAKKDTNFELGIRDAITAIPDYFPKLAKAMVWDHVAFINDKPGKNTDHNSLTGGGDSTRLLMEQLNKAEHSVLIQSPYLVVTERGIAVFKQLRQRGVRVKVVTNSLLSTDNLMAFSGYVKRREELLKAGIEIFEFKPYPSIQTGLIKRHPRLRDKNPRFSLHAKSMVIDGHSVYVGTFNLDPRSANLNTEVGVFINNESLAGQVDAAIRRDMAPQNSWPVSKKQNPDSKASLKKRIKLFAYTLLPLEPIL